MYIEMRQYVRYIHGFIVFSLGAGSCHRGLFTPLRFQFSPPIFGRTSPGGQDG